MTATRIEGERMSIFGNKRESNEERQTRLTELENTITQARSHMRQAAAAGDALNEIRQERLYLILCNSFEEYVAQRWNMTKQNAYDLMAAADVLKQLAGHEQQPTSIRQAKQLARVPEAERVETWNEIVDAAPIDERGQKTISGKDVQKAAAKRNPKKKRKSRGTPKPQRVRVPGATVIIERNKTGANHDAEKILTDALAKLRG